MPSNLLTPIAIKAALTQSKASGSEVWLPDSDGRGAGRLFLRARPIGGYWVFRYTVDHGKRTSIEIGGYSANKSDDAAGGAYTLPQARAKAADFATLLKDSATRDIKAHLHALDAGRQAVRDAAAAQVHQAAEAVRRASEYTLERLLGVYVEHLRKNGKPSAKSMTYLFRKHVSVAHPELARRPASSIKKTDAAVLVRALQNAGKHTAARHLRSYGQAAYSLAASAETNTSAPSEMIAFQIENNPFTPIKGLPGSNARTRTLSDAELSFVIRRLRACTTQGGKVVLAALYTGGQRPQQLLAAERNHWLADSGTLHLLDRKGKRMKPRDHFLPLVGEGLALIERQAEDAAAFYAKLPEQQPVEYLYPVDRKGKSHARLGAVGPLGVDVPSKVITKMSQAMIAAGEAREPFIMKDLRRTVNNLLFREDDEGTVTEKCANRLMSHGLEGIVHKHYVTDQFRNELMHALRLLEKRLNRIETGDPDTTDSNVVAFRKRA